MYDVYTWLYSRLLRELSACPQNNRGHVTTVCSGQHACTEINDNIYIIVDNVGICALEATVITVMQSRSLAGMQSLIVKVINLASSWLSQYSTSIDRCITPLLLICNRSVLFALGFSTSERFQLPLIIFQSFLKLFTP